MDMTDADLRDAVVLLMRVRALGTRIRERATCSEDLATTAGELLTAADEVLRVAVERGPATRFAVRMEVAGPRHQESIPASAQVGSARG